MILFGEGRSFLIIVIILCWRADRSRDAVLLFIDYECSSAICDY